MSGQSAAAVHGLGELVPAQYELTTAARRQTSQPDLRYRQARLSAADVVTMDGLPVTSVSRTVHDLAAAGTDLDHLAVVVKDALESGTRASALAAALDPGAHRYKRPSGQDLLAHLLDLAGHRPDHAALGLYADLLQQRLLASLAPEVGDVVDEALAERLGNLSPVAEEMLAPAGLASSQVKGFQVRLPPPPPTCLTLCRGLFRPPIFRGAVRISGVLLGVVCAAR